MSDSQTKSVPAMLALFRDIACLRRGPQDLPVSWQWLLICIVAQALTGILIGSLLPAVPEKPGVEDHTVALLALDVAMPLLWGWAILRLVGRSERFLQMMTAMFGCQLVLQPLIVTAYWATLYYDKESTWFMPAQFLLLGLSVWLTVAWARIVRAATDWPMFSCVGLVISQGLLTYLLALAIFPDMADALKQAQ